MTEKTEKSDTEAATTPDPFIPVEQQRVTRYQEELKKHTQGQQIKFTVTTRTSIDSTLQHKASIEEQKNILRTLIPTVAIIFVLFLAAVQTLFPQHLMLAIFLSPAVTVSILLASTKVNRNTLKSVGKLKEKLRRKPKPTSPITSVPGTPTITPTPSTPTVPKPKRSLHLKQKLASESVPILLLPITTAACVILYLLQAPYYIFFWITLVGFCYCYVLKVWLTRHIQIRITVKKRKKTK